VQIIYLVSEKDSDPGAGGCVLQAETIGQRAERYRIRVERPVGRRGLAALREEIERSLVHLCGRICRRLPEVLAMGAPAVVCDTGGAELPPRLARGFRQGRFDADRVRVLTEGEPPSEPLYDEICEAAGLPVPGTAADTGDGVQERTAADVEPAREETAADAEPGGRATAGDTPAENPARRASGEPLKILMVTQEDPFYLPLFFREFFRIARTRERLAQGGTQHAAPQAGTQKHGAENGAEHEPAALTAAVRGLMLQRPLGNKTKKGLAKRMWRLYGPFGFLRMGFRYAYAKLAPWHRGVAGEAARAGVPLLEENDANSPEFLSRIASEQVDLLVSVSASQIFKSATLQAPRLGCINLHNAPLPRYRGMLPNFWQMYHNEPHSVLTIHTMAEELDRGEILCQRHTPIEEGMSLESLIRLTKVRSARALWTVLDRYAAGTIHAEPLPAEEGSYFSWPTREQAREFRRRGKRLL
jgi:methionyl-tRNA formyltransferase